MSRGALDESAKFRVILPKVEMVASSLNDCQVEHEAPLLFAIIASPDG